MAESKTPIYDEMVKKHGISLEMPKTYSTLPPLSAAQQEQVRMYNRQYLNDWWEKQSEINPLD